MALCTRQQRNKATAHRLLPTAQVYSPPHPHNALAAATTALLCAAGPKLRSSLSKIDNSNFHRVAVRCAGVAAGSVGRFTPCKCSQRMRVRGSRSRKPLSRHSL
jgi:hypothetical protein